MAEPVKKVSFTLNNRTQRVQLPPDTPLLYVLRSVIGMTEPKFGCGLGQCSACMVLMNGRATHSCTLPLSSVEGQEILTLGALGSRENPHPIQKAFIEEQAMQCGYCINGVIMAGKSLLDQNPDPSDDEIRNALAPVLCRCGAHHRMIKAIKRAAKKI